MPLLNSVRNFKYEVAFSFLQQDESLAYQINDFIQDRLSTFIYSQHQKELVGTNGVDIFSEVFGMEARIVVVLYREEWGNTYWTRVEETAIKRRAQEESADFTVFISLDKQKPIWLSKTQLWYDFERFGSKPTAAIIEKKVSEYGGLVREESIEDLASRHLRELDRKRELQTYLDSKLAYQDVQIEVAKLLEYAKNNIDKINNPEKNFSFGTETARNIFGCSNFGIKLRFNWIEKYCDSIQESYLLISISKAAQYNFNNNRPNIVREQQYHFSLNEANTKGWLSETPKKEFKTTEQFVDLWQKDFLNSIRKERNTK